MWEVFMLACALGRPDMCLIIENTRGPYDTKEICIERAKVMIQEAPSFIPWPHQIIYKCIPLGVTT